MTQQVLPTIGSDAEKRQRAVYNLNALADQAEREGSTWCRVHIHTLRYALAEPAANTGGKGGPIDPAKLKSYVERIEAVEAEEADYKTAKKDIYVEVKAAGMRPKMVRKLVRDRKKTEADAEEEAELELYRAALAMPGATFRSVSAQTGIPKSTLQRLVPRNKNGTGAPKAEDGDDGITESCGGVDGHAQSVGNVVSRDEPTATVITVEPCRPVGAGVEPGPHDAAIVSTGGPGDNHASGPADEAPATPSVGAVAAEPRVAPHHHDDDDLVIPPFLRRTPEQGRGA